MVTGFGPFELPTCGLLQRGQDHSIPKACFYLRSPALGWLSQYYEYTVAKQNGGWTEWVELFITLTRGMCEPTHGLLLSLIASWWDVCETCSEHPVLKVLLLDIWGCTAATLLRYVILCASLSNGVPNLAMAFLH